MIGRTHLLGGVIAGEILTMCTGTPIVSVQSGVNVLVSAAGALFPDIDYARSTVSKANALTHTISAAVTAVSKHRGFFHTPACIAVISLLYGLTVFSRWPAILYAFDAGMLSHLILDTLNPSGVMWFYPLSRIRIHLMKIRTGRKGEKIVRYILLAGIAALTVSLLALQITGVSY